MGIYSAQTCKYLSNLCKHSHGITAGYGWTISAIVCCGLHSQMLAGSPVCDNEQEEVCNLAHGEDGQRRNLQPNTGMPTA